MTTEDSTEVLASDFDIYIDLYLQEKHINSLDELNQSQWKNFLFFIYNHMFKGTMRIKKNSNDYNMPEVIKTCDYYIHELCNQYSKDVSITDFCLMTGISDAIIQEWSKDTDTYSNGKTRLNNAGLVVYQKLKRFRMDSLYDNGLASKGNPLLRMARLNFEYGWNSSDGVALEQKQIATARRDQAILPPPTEEIPAICSPVVDNDGD